VSVLDLISLDTCKTTKEYTYAQAYHASMAKEDSQANYHLDSEEGQHFPSDSELELKADPDHLQDSEFGLDQMAEIQIRRWY
jgi:hypothetical protein